MPRMNLPASQSSTRSTSSIGYRCGSSRRIMPMSMRHALLVVCSHRARLRRCRSPVARGLERAPARRRARRARAAAASATRPASIRDAAAPETRWCRRRLVGSSRTTCVAAEIIVPSAIFRCPEIIAAPPIRQLRPMRVDPGDADAAGDRRMRADHAVVADLDLVVELDVVLDHRVVDRAAVDRRVGADLDVGADDDAADLRNLEPAAAVVREAEAVGADDRAAVDERARADDAARIDGDARVAARASSPIDAPSPTTPCAPTTRALADRRARADHGKRPDRRPTPRPRAAHRRSAVGCDAGRDRRRGMQDRRDARIRRVGVGRDELGSARRARVAGRDDHRGCARRRKLRAIPRIGEERDVARPGALERGDARDRRRAVAVEGRAGAAREFGERMQRGPAMGRPSWPSRRTRAATAGATCRRAP